MLYTYIGESLDAIHKLNINIYTFFEIKHTHFQPLTKYCYLILQLFYVHIWKCTKIVCIFVATKTINDHDNDHNPNRNC